MYHTLGQRKGLHIGGQKGGGGNEEPWYVADKDLKRNVLIAVQGADHPLLKSEGLIASQLHWVDRSPLTSEIKCSVKTRYRQNDIPCTIVPINNGAIKVIFDNPQVAVTPGQSAVFYQGDVCLGGGIIEERL